MREKMMAFCALCCATLITAPGCIVRDIRDEMVEINDRLERVEVQLEGLERANESMATANQSMARTNEQMADVRKAMMGGYGKSEKRSE